VTRYERKFLATTGDASAVAALVRRHPAVFREVFPERIVNNVYLDTPSRRDYHDHVNGAGVRQKSRVRWYGDLAPSGAIALEVKSRHGALSGKQTYALGRFDVDGQPWSHAVSATLDRSLLPDALRLALRLTEPALVNRYRRRYFLSADGCVRLTVDSSLEWHAVGRHTLTRVLPGQPSPVIVELKYGPDDADAAEAVASRLPWRLTRFSKYVRGIEAIRIG
jgi:hypothetical protein